MTAFFVLTMVKGLVREGTISDISSRDAGDDKNERLLFKYLGTNLSCKRWLTGGGKRMHCMGSSWYDSRVGAW